MSIRIGVLAFSFLILVGCARVPKEAGFGEVQQYLSQRMDQSVRWRRGAQVDPVLTAKLESLLSRPLDADAAVQVALLRNPSLQATYERLGVAQADVVQAGLLSNPVLSGSARFPNRSPSGTNLEGEIAQEFINILLRPARKRLAERQFLEVKLQVADEVLDLATRVRRAYYTLQGAQNLAAVIGAVAEAAGTSSELARRLERAGNLSELAANQERALSEQAQLDLLQARSEVFIAREELGRLMGVQSRATAWSIGVKLPDVPPREVELRSLEATALSQRLDLAAARENVEIARKALSLSGKSRWIPFAQIGVDSERDTDRQVVTGPTLSIEAPVFDQGQARIARARSQLRQSEERSAALRADAVLEVRRAREKVLNARARAARYRQTLVPLRERIVALSMEQYNYMLIGAFEVLAAKQAELNTYRGYIDSVRDYWIARSDLERTIGARLPAPPRVAQVSPSRPRTKSRPAPPPEPPAHRHHH